MAIRLALGAIAAALVVPSIGAPSVIALALGGAALLLGLVLLDRQRGGDDRADWLRRWIALPIAASAIALRVALAPVAIPANGGVPVGSGPWEATVESISALRDGDRPALVRLATSSLLVAATLPAYPAVAPGDTIRIEGAIRPPPDGEYGEYLRRIGAGGTIFARGAEILGEGSGVAGALERARRSASDALARAIPEPEAGLAAGIVVGLRDRVDRDLSRDFAAVGASHVVAISGWNIAIVAGTLGALGGRVRRRRRVLLIILAIALYTAFVGPSPSVVRAAVMAAVVLVAREVGRPSRAAAAMGWAIGLLLLLDPAMVEDVGFRLSVLATAGLLAWGTPLSRWMAGREPGRVRGWLAESLGVSLAAQAATLPIVLAEFGRLSIVAPAVNLAVVPLVAPAMAASTVALVAGLATAAGLPALLATIGGLPAWGLLGGIVGAVRVGASLPFASLALAPPWDSLAAGASGIVVLASPWAIRQLRRRRAGRSPGRLAAAALLHPRDPSAGPRGHSAGRAATLALATGVVVFGVGFAYRPDGAARIVVLDVGQGDAILVVGARGSTLLVDGGPDPARLLVALDEELPPWDRRVDTVVLTHPHEDHVAGLVALLEAERVGRVYEPGMPGNGPGYAAWQRALRDHGVGHGTLGRGDRLRVDDVRLDVLWPEGGAVPSTASDDGRVTNDVSIVLLGLAAGHRFLLTGDVEDDVDPRLVQLGLPRVDLLKVAHHGSRTASSQALLDATHPSVAVISVGAGNDYGHPAPETLRRLGLIGATTYRTDRDGTVEVRLGPGAVGATTKGRRRAASSGAWTASRPGSASDRGAAGDARAGRAAIAIGASADRGLLYHRADDGPLAHGGGIAPPVVRSTRLARSPLTRRGGDRGVARGSGGWSRRERRCRARRVGRSPPRRRQGAAPRTPAGRERAGRERDGTPPARRRERRVAPRPGSRGARRGGRMAPRRPPRRRGLGGARRGTPRPRDADRGLRRQARGAAPRDARAALRGLGTPLSRRLADGDVATRAPEGADPRGTRVRAGGREPGGRGPAALDGPGDRARVEGGVEGGLDSRAEARAQGGIETRVRARAEIRAHARAEASRDPVTP